MITTSHVVGPAQQNQRNDRHDQQQDAERYPMRGIVDDDVHAHDIRQRGDRQRGRRDNGEPPRGAGKNSEDGARGIR